jgi:hypothetical protein
MGFKMRPEAYIGLTGFFFHLPDVAAALVFIYHRHRRDNIIHFGLLSY